MCGGGEPLDGADLRGNLVWQLGLAGEHVEATDGPRVVGPFDVADELHHFVVAGNALRAHLGIDGVLDGGALADGDEARLEEGDRHGRVMRGGVRDGAVTIRLPL